MTTEERITNLDKARAARSQQLADRRTERAAAFAIANPAYLAAVGAYYVIRSQYGEGSSEEKVAFRKMLDAEVAWFRCHPRDGDMVAA